MNTKKNIFLKTSLSAKNTKTEELVSPAENTFFLTKREAKAASPADMAVCGEEDPGEALELLVRGNIPPKP